MGAISTKKPIIVIALILAMLVLFLELGYSFASFFPLPPPAALDLNTLFKTLDINESDVPANFSSMSSTPPGYAIRYLSFIDGLILLITFLIVAPLFFSKEAIARAQGLATLVISFLILLSALSMLVIVLAKLILMISLLLAAPFGTLIYMVKYGFFNTGSASILLSLLMLFKLGLAVCFILGQPELLKNKGLVGLIATSLLANVIIGFLHVFPNFLVSITDAIGAIIVVILGIIWALILLIGAIGPTLKALRP